MRLIVGRRISCLVMPIPYKNRLPKCLNKSKVYMYSAPQIYISTSNITINNSNQIVIKLFKLLANGLFILQLKRILSNWNILYLVIRLMHTLMTLLYIYNITFKTTYYGCRTLIHQYIYTLNNPIPRILNIAPSGFSSFSIQIYG